MEIIEKNVHTVVIGSAKACMHAQLLQFCPTLCDPMNCSVPGSSIYSKV